MVLIGRACGTLSRIEIEKYITAEELEYCLESLPENLRNNPIVDNYIMFDNVEAANAYTPPFEGTEVTDNPDYYKRNYWKKTRLEK